MNTSSAVTSLASAASASLATMPPSPPVTSPQSQSQSQSLDHTQPPRAGPGAGAGRTFRRATNGRQSHVTCSQPVVVLHLDSSPLPPAVDTIQRVDSGLCNPPTTRSFSQLLSDSDPHDINAHSHSSDLENAARPAKRLRTHSASASGPRVALAPKTPLPLPDSVASYAPPSPLKSCDNDPLSSPALYTNPRDSPVLHLLPQAQPHSVLDPSPCSHLERLPTRILTHHIAGRYIQQLASLAALAATSRNLFAKIAPLVWRDPWDLQVSPAVRLGGGRYQDDPTLLQAVRNGMTLGVEMDGNLGENAPTGYYAQHVTHIPSQSATHPWTAQTSPNATLQLALENASPKSLARMTVDLTRCTGIIADLTAEKHRRRLLDPFWTHILVPRASTLTSLHVESASALFPHMASAIARNGGQPLWPHLRELHLAFHVGTADAMRHLARVLTAHADELHSLSLTMLNAAHVRVLDPLREVGSALCNLRRLHLVPVDDAISPTPDLALWLADFIAAFPTATFRHIELYPVTEYARSHYYARSLASAAGAAASAAKVDRLTLWLPHAPHAITKHVLPLLGAWGGSHLAQLDLAPYTQHPRANWGGLAPALTFAGRDRSLYARFARTSGGLVVPEDLGAQLALQVPGLRTLHMYCLAIDESLAHVHSLHVHPRLVHVHLGLAPPCLQASPLDPPPRRVDPELARRMAGKVALHGAYAAMARVVRGLVVAEKPHGGEPIRSVSWMSLPMAAGEARVFDADQRAFAATTDALSGVPSVVGQMGLVMRYEEDANGTWAVCALGVHACWSMRRHEAQRRAAEVGMREGERKGPVTRRQAAAASRTAKGV